MLASNVVPYQAPDLGTQLGLASRIALHLSELVSVTSLPGADQVWQRSDLLPLKFGGLNTFGISFYSFTPFYRTS